MNSIFKKYQYIISGIILGLVIVYFVSQQVVNIRLGEFKNNIEQDLSVSEEEIVNLAKLIAQGGRNEMATNVIQDCNSDERNQFDSNLSRLDEGLTSAELEDLDRLFSRCAPVSAIHRSVMTMQLRQEVQNFENLIEKRKSLGEYSKSDTLLKELKTLLEAEEKISDLSFSLVSLQKEIIETLLSGVKANSAETDSLKLRGQVARNEISSIVNEISYIRKNLFGT